MTMLTLKQIYAIFDILGFSVYVTKWTNDLKTPVLWKVYNADGQDLRGEMSLMHLRNFAASFGVNPDTITAEIKREAQHKRALVQREGMPAVQRTDAKREYYISEVQRAFGELKLAHLTTADDKDAKREFIEDYEADNGSIIIERVHWLLGGDYGKRQQVLAHFACFDSPEHRAIRVLRILAACEWQIKCQDFAGFAKFERLISELHKKDAGRLDAFFKAIETEIDQHFSDTEKEKFTRSEVLGQ